MNNYISYKILSDNETISIKNNKNLEKLETES